MWFANARQTRVAGIAGLPWSVLPFAFLILCALFFGMRASAQPVAGAPVILAIGESTTAGWGVGPDESYPAQLQAMLAAHGHIYQVVNQGRSGSTTRMALNNLHRGMMLQPKIVLVALGGNDRSNRMGSGETRENLRKIISMYVRTGAIVFLADRNPRSDGSEPEGASLFAELAAEEGAMLMPSLRQDIAGKQEFLLADMSHPNAAGYTIVAERIHALLEPHL